MILLVMLAIVGTSWACNAPAWWQATIAVIAAVVSVVDFLRWYKSDKTLTELEKKI